jgi:hypothetical protein
MLVEDSFYPTRIFLAEALGVRLLGSAVKEGSG